MSSEDLPNYSGVTEAEIDEQATLPLARDLDRPRTEAGHAYCPEDDLDVTTSLKGHYIDGAHLVDRQCEDVEAAPVYGYCCPYCSTVLPVDPSSDVIDLPGPATGVGGWVAVRAELADGHGHVLVPWGVTHP